MMPPEAVSSLFPLWCGHCSKRNRKRPASNVWDIDRRDPKHKLPPEIENDTSSLTFSAPELIDSDLVSSEPSFFETSAAVQFQSFPSTTTPSGLGYTKASTSGSSSQVSLPFNCEDFDINDDSGGTASKRKPVKIVSIKQEKCTDFEGLELVHTENSQTRSSTKIEKKSDELPLVTTIPIGGEEFIASVLAATSEESSSLNIPASKDNGEIASSTSVETYSKDKVIQLSGDHTYFEFKSPKKKVILKITKNPEKPADKVKTLEELIDILVRENLLNSEARCMMEAFLELPEGLIRRRSQNRLMTRPDMKYTKGVQKFASTLYFYSPRSYDFVRKIFILPEMSALQASLRVCDHYPGFTQEVLSMLKDAFSNVPRPSRLCSIMIVNVKIQEQCDFDICCGRVIGHVDFGGGQDYQDSDEVPTATDALLFIVVGLASNWKIPFGYFLNNGLSGEFLKSLVNEAIISLEESHLEVRTLVCDGQNFCLPLCKQLGCKVNVKTFRDIETSFQHPIVSDRKVHLIFDASHGLKLLKNLLVDKGSLHSTTYGKIEWKYLKSLLETCDVDELDVNPEAYQYLEFYRQKLKLLIGCHSIGNSVGKVLELIAQDPMQESEGHAATANFAADIDRAFDTLNSRNPVAPGERSPMYQYTVEEQKESLTFVARRMMGLELPSGKRVVDDSRRMSVCTFAATLKGVSQLAAELVSRNIIRYLCTFRLNLDHAQVILNSLQKIGEWNGQPSAIEFRRAYKKLVEKASILANENTLYTNDFEGEDITVGQGIIYPYRTQCNIPALDIDNFTSSKSCLVDYGSENMYRARFVVTYVARRLSCSECIEILLDDDFRSMFLNPMANEIHLTPSKLVLKVLKTAEKSLTHSMQSQFSNIEQLITFTFSEYAMLNLMLGVKENAIAHFVEEPHHVICLIKMLIRTFFTLRLKIFTRGLKRRIFNRSV